MVSTKPHRIENVKKPYSIPFYFKRTDGRPFNLADIYAVSPDQIVTFTILTKDATPLFAKIHNKKKRRPVIIRNKDIEVWLDNTLTEKNVIQLIENDMSDSDINAYPISKDLYKSKGEGDTNDIIQKVEYADLQLDCYS